MNAKRNLPTIQEIYDESVDIVRENKLNVLLNQAPKESWIKQHPIIKNCKYLPIERVEYMLTSIFIRWHAEIKTVQLIANSVVVTVRLHYLNPVTNEMDYQDGVGASPLQTDKDASATDWSRIKSDAVMKSAPAAESFAIKDAAEKIGKLFGKDLNRADQIIYDTLMNKFDGNGEDKLTNRTKELIELIDKIPEKELRVKTKNKLQKIREAKQLTLEVVENMLDELSQH